MRWIVSGLKGVARWFGALPRAAKVAFVVVAILVVGAAAFATERAYNYTQEDPRFCRACHTMEQAWDRWATSEHRSVNCHSCHELSPIQGLEQLVMFTLNQPQRVSKHAVVHPEVCMQCHESGNPRWRQVTDTAGHRVHAEEQGLACTKCHSVTLHRFEVPKKICGVCHEEKKVEVAAMGTLHCISCHQFLTPNGSLLPTREPCLSCHQKLASPRILVTWPEVAPMKTDCKQCHEPHQQAAPIVNCLTCHQEASAKGLHVAKTHAATTCQTCHKPHEWQVTKRDNCLICHPSKVEHNPGPRCDACHSFR